MVTQTITAAASGISESSGPASAPGVNPRRTRCTKAARTTPEATAVHVDLTAARVQNRDELTVKLMSLVKRVAREMRDRLPAHVDVDDLVSAGTLGLIDAVRRFESGKQVKIETYARYRIRGAILDALRNLDTASRDMRKKNKRAERVFQELAVKLGRSATDSEMAEALHVRLKDWYKTVNDLQSMGVEWLRPTHMGTARQPGEDELPATNPQDQFDLCYRQEQRDLLNRALDRVSERERLVLMLYYEKDFTMKEIGDQLGIDESRVSQIHSAALGRLRNKVQTMLRPPVQPRPAATRFAAQL